MPDDLHLSLLEKIQSRRAVVGIIGLGYVGLPLALATVNAGYHVVGFDTDEAKPGKIAAGESYLRHISATALKAATETGRFGATSDFSRIGDPDVLIICVPTPLRSGQIPDLSFVCETAETVAKALKPGRLVVLESTTYPGTTDEVLRPILESTGHESGSDVFLAFSPEREDPGNKSFETASIPKLVGADDDRSRTVASSFYRSVFETIVEVSGTKVAEAAKLTENIFRSVNIALVNELKTIYEPMGVDIWEVIDAAKTKPFGFMPFYPGPGLGGHCIPIDPFYLSWKAREHGVRTRFIELAGEINSAMPGRVVDKLALVLDARQGRGLNGAAILLIGAAYKKNVDDMRESSALQIMALLESRGAHTDYYDPFVPKIPMTREHPGLAGRESAAWSSSLPADYDAVLIVTDHDDVDYGAIQKSAKLVIDTRNALRKAGLSGDNLVLA